MASDLISRDVFIKEYCGKHCGCNRNECGFTFEEDGCDGCAVITEWEKAPAVDAIPIDDVAEMLAELFGEECCCNYNGIDEWLPFLCEHSDTCPDVIGTNGCWKQFIKHWRGKNDEID